MTHLRTAALALGCLMLATTLAGTHAVAANPTPDSMGPQELLSAIRKQFRTHRPPPAYESYTMERKQDTNYGYPDYAFSYIYHIWVRNSDRAALTRKESRLGAHGQLEFRRPMFNIDDDPGPPTADLFEQAPVRATAGSFVPTPEPAATPESVIASVKVVYESDYHVTKVAHEGTLLHLSVEPKRDVERNRLREIYADAKSLELVKVIATDKLFVLGDRVYPTTFTIELQPLDGRPVVTHIHGVVGDNFTGDGQEVDYYFRDIKFPSSLPSWYFDARTYREHVGEAPL